MSLYARIAALVAVMLFIGACWWKFESVLDAREKVGYERRAAEDAAAMREQAERNRELQRSAEKRYTVQTGIREEFITVTVKEVHHATANLSACVLTPDARRLLNDAADCASNDSPAACGAGKPVR